ncbi:MAG: putative baseplate assembly protein [Acidobacteriota bacterium]
MKEMKQKTQTPETCDCCKGVEVLTPVATFNRPGLNTIAYRAGTHGSFLETMKARLSSSEFPKLAGLTTRESSDASIALLDAWAIVADVLTFYQERIAIEGFLRTATERRSILELARLVGYRLRPGLAASVYLAYTLEPTQQTTIIDIGNKAQSLPGPNETPQVFETAEKLIAHSGLNLMRPRLTHSQVFQSAEQLINPTVTLKGVATNLRSNDVLLLDFAMINTVQSVTAVYRANEVGADPQLDRTTVRVSLQGQAPSLALGVVNPVAAQSGDALTAIAAKYQRLDSFGLSSTSVIVKRVTARLVKLTTDVSALAGDEASKKQALAAELSVLIRDLTGEYTFASARGYVKISPWLSGIKHELEATQTFLNSPSTTPTTQTVPPPPATTTTPSFVQLFQSFKDPQSNQPRNEANLDRKAEQILSQKSEFVAQAYAALQPRAAPFVNSVLANASSIQVVPPSPKTPAAAGLSKVQALRIKAGLAGRNLPTIIRETSDPDGAKVSTRMSPPTLRDYVTALAAAHFPATVSQALVFVALDAQYDQIKAGSTVAIERPVVGSVVGVPGAFTRTIHKVTAVRNASLSFFDVSSVSTVLTLDSPWLSAVEVGQAAATNSLITNTLVFAQSEELSLAETDITDDISFAPDDSDPVIELDGFYSSLEPGRWAIISGSRVVRDTQTKEAINTGVEVSELFMVAAVVHEAKTFVGKEALEVKGEKLHTFIHPAKPLAYRYRRSTVKIYGNVVRATHGETRNEVLGSGDGSKMLQSFPLRQPPLTYLAAPTPSGAGTTLDVRVNDVRWREADNLFVLDRLDRKYVTKTDDEGKTTVIFGDGQHGARLTTGVENVKAVYRSGIGRAGNVKAEQIKLPMTKPLGVKGVINPLPASGGADRETRDQARRNAPIGVLALDRLVSVQDYAFFARTFAGIAKASARRLSDGAREVVHLTISGVGDIPIDLTSDLYRNLVAALKRFGDPLQPLQVEASERVLLVVSAQVKLLPDYLWVSVNAKIRAALFDKFGFESRDLGQDVPQSEVLSVIQSVPGVDYIDLDLLDSVNEAKLADPNFGAKLTLKSRVNADLARMPDNDILPAQLVFLSPGAADTLILGEAA